MLRVYLLQLWFELSDPAAEETPYESLWRCAVSPASTSARKERLLERHKLGKKLLWNINGYLARNWIKVGNAPIVDTTIITSTKTKDGKATVRCIRPARASSGS